MSEKWQYEVTRLAVYKDNEVFDIDGVDYMPVPRCETCKHWDYRGTLKGPNGQETNQRIGACLKADYALDGSSQCWPEWDGQLVTRPDFGCVQWEAKA